MKRIKHLIQLLLKKDLVCHIPFQVSEFNDESFDDLKGENFVEKPLECEEFLGSPSPSCEEDHGSQDYENIDSFSDWKA